MIQGNDRIVAVSIITAVHLQARAAMEDKLVARGLSAVRLVNLCALRDGTGRDYGLFGDGNGDFWGFRVSILCVVWVSSLVL